MLGETLAGRYRILSEIARGGMGVVYEAVHVTLGQRVAVKLMSGSDDPTVAERFHREARAASALGHPNMVRVFDLGVLPGGQPYMVMEYLEGENLFQLLQRNGQMPATVVVDLLRGVANALDTAHARGLLHRDLKLDNLFVVTREDGNRDVKLVDFGLAVYLAAADQRLTDDGLVVGTPVYMAPEAIDGGALDHRSDVYSLAVVVYELLTGRLPFQKTRDTRTLLLTKAKDAAPRLSTSTVSFAAEIEAVMARALARKPSERHPTAGAFMRDLTAAARNLPLHPLTAERAGLSGRGETLSLPPANKSRERPTVLIVDHDRAFRGELSRSLRREGFRRQLCGSAAEAMAAMAVEAVDVAIVDGLLPDASGVELVERLRAHGYDGPIVFASAHWRDAASTATLKEELGVDLVVSKPILADALAVSVSKLVPDRPSERRDTRGLDRKLEDDLAAAHRLLRGVDALEEQAIADARDVADRAHQTAQALGWPQVAALTAQIGAALGNLEGERGATVRLHVERTLEEVESAQRLVARHRDDADSGRRVQGRVLVVDDDLEVLRHAEYAGRRAAVEVQTAADVESAMQALKNPRFDGLLLRVDGNIAVEELLSHRGRWGRLPLGVIAEVDDIGTRLAAARRRALAVLPPKMTDEQLIDLVIRFKARRSGATATVLVVDDDPEITGLVAAWLASVARVVRLHQPREILDTLRRERPDLLLVDVVMPELDGLDVCKIVRATHAWRDIPVLTMSATGDLASRLACFDAGSDGFVPKPIEKAELVTRVRAMLERANVRSRAGRDAPVAGALTRKAFVGGLNAMLAAAQRENTPVALGIVEVDGYGKLQDAGSRATANDWVRRVGRLLRGRLRADDLRGYWGEGHFVLALPGENADAIAEVLERLDWGLRRSGKAIAFNTGMAVFPWDGDTSGQLLRVADERLTAVKLEREVSAPPPDESQEHRLP